MSELKIFEKAEFGQIRTTEVNGRIYFVGIDIAKALGYANPLQVCYPALQRGYQIGNTFKWWDTGNKLCSRGRFIPINYPQ